METKLNNMESEWVEVEPYMRNDLIRITITKRYFLYFSEAFVKILKENDYAFFKLYFNEKNKILKFLFTKKKEIGSRKITYNKINKACISLRGFINYYSLIKETAKYEPTINKNEVIIYLNMPIKSYAKL